MVKPSQTVYVDFSTQDASGALSAADSLPAGTLIRNGTDTAETVTVTNKTGGRYSASFTIPSGYVTGDSVEIFITATIDSISAGLLIWRDIVDAQANSDIAADIAALNDLSPAESQIAADLALQAYDPPTKAEMDAGFAGQNDLDSLEVVAAAETALNAYDGPTKAEMDASFSALNDLSPAESQIAADLALQAYDPPTKAEMDAGFAGQNDLDSLEVVAAAETALNAYDPPTKAEMDAAFALLNDLSATDVLSQINASWAVQVDGTVPIVGTKPTREQSLWMAIQFMIERVVLGTIMTIGDENGNALFTLNLNDATAPSSVTRQ